MSKQDRFLKFLQDELTLPSGSIEFGFRHAQATPNLVPMVLYQYGFVTTQELGQIFDWLENAFSDSL